MNKTKKFDVPHTKIAFNKKQKYRLKLLAMYLINLPKDYTHFDMYEYIQSDKVFNVFCSMDEYEQAINSCGTVACALGHAPALSHIDPVFKLQKVDDEEIQRRIERGNYMSRTVPTLEYFGQYAERVFGIKDYDYEHKDTWSFCFGAWWRNYDNTPQGAAKRILYMLKNGAPERVWFQYTDLVDPSVYDHFTIDVKDF